MQNQHSNTAYQGPQHERKEKQEIKKEKQCGEVDIARVAKVRIMIFLPSILHTKRNTSTNTLKEMIKTKENNAEKSLKYAV